MNVTNAINPALSSFSYSLSGCPHKDKIPQQCKYAWILGISVVEVIQSKLVRHSHIFT